MRFRKFFFEIIFNIVPPHVNHCTTFAASPGVQDRTPNS